MTSLSPHDPLPLVDPKILRDLEEELGNPTIARAFARDFTAVWEDRYLKLATAVARRDASGSLDAVLSLKITSIMVGASQLAQLAIHVEEVIRSGDMDGAAATMATIRACGDRTVQELLDNYILDPE